MKKNKRNKVTKNKLSQIVNFSGLGSTLVAGGVRAKDITNKRLAKLWKQTHKNLKKIQKILKKKLN